MLLDAGRRILSS